jgi:hypothetical protein
MTALASTVEMWTGRVRAWREVGGSAESFARGKGFSGSSLRVWGNRLSRPGVSSGARVVALVARGADGGLGPGEVVIEVGAVRVRVAAGFDRAVLADVLAVVGGAR